VLAPLLKNENYLTRFLDFLLNRSLPAMPAAGVPGAPVDGAVAGGGADS
jgi:hypothetical protein